MTRDRQKAKAIGKVLTVLIVVSLAFVVSAGAADDSQLTVVLKDKANVSSKYVQVKDVAKIEGGDQKTIDEIGGIYLGLAPELGKEITVDMTWVQKRIKQNAFDMNLIDFKGAAETVITGIKEEEKAKEVKAAKDAQAKDKDVENEINEQEEGDADYIMVNSNTIANIILKYMAEEHETPEKNLYVNVHDKIRWKSIRGEELKRAAVIEPINILFEKRNSNMATVMFRVTDLNGNSVRNEVKAEIAFIGDCITIKQAVRRGETLKLDMLTLEPIKISITEYLNVVKTLDGCVGRRVVKALREGDMVFESDLDKPADIRTDDIIAVDVKAEGYIIRSVAIASESGSIGDYIQVKNFATKRPWAKEVKITGPGTAELVISSADPTENDEKEETPRRNTKRDNKRNNDEKRKNENVSSEQPSQFVENNRYRGPVNKSINVEACRQREKTKFGGAVPSR